MSNATDELTLSENTTIDRTFYAFSHSFASVACFIWVVESALSLMVAPFLAMLCDGYQYCADECNVVYLLTALRSRL